MIAYITIGILFILAALLAERWRGEKNMATFWEKQARDLKHEFESQLENRAIKISRLTEMAEHRNNELNRLSKEIAESYVERLKLERQLEHLATGPNAIYRDNIRLRKELQEANKELLPKREAELRAAGYLS